MNACVFVLIFMISNYPMPSLGSKKNQIFTLSVDGPKKVPIRGFLLHGGDKTNSLSLKKVESIGKVANINSGRLTSVETKLKSLKQDVNILKLLLEANGEVYIGCFIDDADRHLKHRLVNMGNYITLAKCKQHCKGYKYAGLQSHMFCLCGNQLLNKKYPPVSEAECKTACKGEPKRMCGAPSRNSIYRV